MIVVDKPFTIFSDWTGSFEDWLLLMIALGFFIVGPLLGIIFRRNFKIFSDRIEITYKLIRKNRKYLFADLLEWSDFDLSYPASSRFIKLKFKNKKISIHSSEVYEYRKMINFFETNFNDKRK